MNMTMMRFMQIYIVRVHEPVRPVMKEVVDHFKEERQWDEGQELHRARISKRKQATDQCCKGSFYQRGLYHIDRELSSVLFYGRLIALIEEWYMGRSRFDSICNGQIPAKGKEGVGRC